MSISSDHEAFRNQRAGLDELDPTAFAEIMRESGVVSVGILIGGGFPASAACVSLLLEARFPDARWPWTDAEA